MPREFSRDMLIMLVAIMAGVVIITFFIADIQARNQVTEELTVEYNTRILYIEKQNINFSSAFLDALGGFDLAREFKADGDVQYSVARSFFSVSLFASNVTLFEYYINITIANCMKSFDNFKYSGLNFNDSIGNFNLTKIHTNYDVYLNLTDLYVNISESGYKLSRLKQNASEYLLKIAENLTFENLSSFPPYIEEFLSELERLEYEIIQEEEIYDWLRYLIDEYELDVPER